MKPDGNGRIEAITALLSDTEAAHGVFESTELKGVYDQEWPAWYAAHAIELGIGAVLGHPVTTERLAQFLTNSFAEFKQTEPKPTEGWAAWITRRIAAEL